jgi:hypothetical protein
MPKPTLSHHPLLLTFLAGVSLVACNAEEELDLDDLREPQGAITPRAGQFPADELFLKLKEAESKMPAPIQREVIDVGTLNGQTGYFAGLKNIPPEWDPELHIWIPGMDAIAPIGAVNATLHFEVTNPSGTFRVTVDGVTHFDSDQDGVIEVDVGRATNLNWEARSGVKSYSDSLVVTRAGVNGVGAFTVGAWPIAMVYEPPTNEAATNEGSFSEITQRTSTTTISSTSAESFKSPPPFISVANIFDKAEALGNKLGSSHPAGLILKNIGNLIGTVRTEVIEGSSISSEKSIELSTADMLSISTSIDMGPGRGDVMGYLKNARLAWILENGKLSVSLIDYETLAYTSMHLLREDLAVARGGGVDTITGLDEASLESLVALNPFVDGEDAALDPSRFVYDQTVEISGVSLAVSASHSRTVTDKQVESSFKTRVSDAESGWLSALGMGVTQDGKTTTTLSQSSSRSVSVGETTEAQFMLAANADEFYSVDIYYDRMFGTFALRRPEGGACPAFDPGDPDGSFCNDPACPCFAGEGDCDSDDQCAPGLRCGVDNGPHYGLPANWDVCVPEFCPVFDPSDPDAAMCNDPECPCGLATGDCDNDSQCAPGLVCGHDVGPLYGLPAGWDVCVDPQCPLFDPDVTDWSFCSADCPCGFGQGDCDSDSECAPGFVCGHDNGPQFGYPKTWDVCVPAE